MSKGRVLALALMVCITPQAGTGQLGSASQTVSVELHDPIRTSSIRGEDEREVRKNDTRIATMHCRGSNGVNYTTGTAVMIRRDRILTIIHNVIDTKDDCTPRYEINSCYLTSGNRKHSVVWERSPINECKNGKVDGKDGDSPIAAKLKPALSKNVGTFRVLCPDAIRQINIRQVTMTSAISANYEYTGRQRDKRNASLVSIGNVYTKKRGGVLNYDNDSGKGSSGAAISITINGESYLVGLHLGDAHVNSDGEPANKFSNFGVGLIVNADYLGIECENPL